MNVVYCEIKQIHLHTKRKKNYTGERVSFVVFECGNSVIPKGMLRFLVNIFEF